jgi:hypothetical protein
MDMNKNTLYAMLISAVLLGACGGGGGGGGDASPLAAADTPSGDAGGASTPHAGNPPAGDPPAGNQDDTAGTPTDGNSTSGGQGGTAPINTAPVARAGQDRSEVVGSFVTLDGSGSSDADNDLLTYAWNFVSRPDGSAATLSGADTVSPGFTPDAAGSYVIALTVSDGTVAGMPDTVTVVAAVGNAAPVADAGPDRTVLVGSPVALDGSGSSDANDDLLTYAWAFVSRPGASTAVLADAATVQPTFTPDVVGEYVVGLTVNDGVLASALSTVTVNAGSGNVAPEANAGGNRTVLAGSSVTLDGSGSSDANGDPLTYQWSLVSKPLGSAAVLSNATAVGPSFTADLPGSYVVSLKVNDGTLDSATIQVEIQAAAATFATAPELAPAPTVLPQSRGSFVCNGYRFGNRQLQGNLSVPAGASCVLDQGVRVLGGVQLGAGATLYAKGLYVEGSLASQCAALVVIEDSRIDGSLTLESGGAVTLRNVSAGGQIQLTGNTGGVTVESNTAGGSLVCADNVPAPTGSGNVALTGTKQGQCAAL